MPCSPEAEDTVSGHRLLDRRPRENIVALPSAGQDQRYQYYKIPLHIYACGTDHLNKEDQKHRKKDAIDNYAVIRLAPVRDQTVIRFSVHLYRFCIKCLTEDRVHRILDHIDRKHGIHQIARDLTRPGDHTVFESEVEKRHDKRVHADKVDITSDRRRDLCCRKDNDQITDHRRDKHDKKHEDRALDLTIRALGHTHTCQYSKYHHYVKSGKCVSHIFPPLVQTRKYNHYYFIFEK